jgi:phage internal scaffolding protein
MKKEYVNWQKEHVNKVYIMRPNGTLRVQTPVLRDEEGKPLSETQQQFKDSCDINKVMKQWRATGQNPHPNLRRGVFADLTEIPNDFQSMLNVVEDSKEAFASLPSQVRLRFNNNPQELLQFLQDPRNAHEAVSLGLMEYSDKFKQSQEEQKQTNQTQNSKTKTKQKNSDDHKNKNSQPSGQNSDSIAEGDE